MIEDMEPSAWDSWDPMKEDHQSSMNSLALDFTGNPIESITGSRSTNTRKVGKVTICERYLKFGECMDKQFCPNIHVDPKNRDQLLTLQETYETNKNRTIITFNYLSPQELETHPEASLLASVTNVISPNNFYIILPYENKDFSQCTSKDLQFYIDQVKTSSPARSKLQDIHNNLANIFDREFRVDNVNDIVYQSQIVACKTKDGHFRRAMVVETPEDESFDYTLFLLDFGTHIKLPREHIFDIRAECLSDAPMAIHCRLDLKPASGCSSWSESILSIFEAMSRGQLYLLCSIMKYSNQDQMYTIDLKHIASRKSLTEKLVETGLVAKTEY